MAFNVIVFCLCAMLGTIRAIDVNISNVWKPNVGWEITCSWKLSSDDSLLFAKMYIDEESFSYGHVTIGENQTFVFTRPNDKITQNCAKTTQQGVTGTCVLTVELLRPQRNSFRSTCEVSGDSPWFRMEEKTIVIDASEPPTKAVVAVESENEQSNRVALNCTSSGLLRPNLVWTIGDQKVPHDFTGGFWDAQSKQWHVWSLLSYTPYSHYSAICTPEINTENRLMKGEAAEYNSWANIQGTGVNLSNIWKPNIGWEISCYWKLFSNDSLQSVRLYINDQQFLIYRPEVDGNNRTFVFRRPDDMLIVNCGNTTPRGVTGICVLTIELLQPQGNSFINTCEVSGERPTFRIDKKSLVIEAFGKPTDAVVEVVSVNEESRRMMLNCSSTGLLRPNLVWTIGDQKVPHDFTGGGWNSTTKLWHVWSLLSYTPTSEHTAVCTPEINTGSQLLKGEPAEYNSVESVKSIGEIVLAAALLLLI